MSTTAHWLERLSRATDYVDLQTMFQELLADLHDGENNAELAEAIDEAIRRLEIERARDAHELESFEQEFAAFREQQRGVVGWFRRHLPFSRTKRQEREHRESIADQRAEILADNLVIARAQMVKEQLLPAAQRQMGHTADAWRSRFRRLRDDSPLETVAAEVQQLVDEVQRSKTFLALLGSELQAFAEADFTAKDDARRQKFDLDSARQELAALQDEFEQELTLQAAGLRQLGELVSADLSQSDDDYRQRYQRSLALGRARTEALPVQTATEQLLEQLKRIVTLENEQFELPKLFQQLEQEASRVRQQADQTRQRHQHLSLQLDQRAGEFDTANRGVEQARSAFDAARRLYEAYVREQGIAELEPRTQASPVFGEYQRQESVLRQAESFFQQIASPFKQMQVEVGDLGRLAETLIRNVEDVLRRQQGNTRRQHEVQESLAAEYHRTRPLFERLASQTQVYLASLGPLGRTTLLPSLDEFQDLTAQARTNRQPQWLPSQDWLRSRNASAARDDFELIRRFQQALHRELEQLEKELVADKDALQAKWTTRTRELLAVELADAVIAQSAEPAA